MASEYIESFQNLDILVLSPTPTYPVDQGNRKRIYAVCQQLRKQGARIHFLHYPLEWWVNIPKDSVKKMTQQWDSFYLIPPTRPGQTPAEGEDHAIDEWWDDTIGDYLKWLFSRAYFDVLLVNYTFLSKAFEFAPDHIYCILDTHDKFTGRRQLLEGQGISREFFYTTEDQEAIALERANLVWAIKEQEEAFFRGISNTPVCTMPHIEPQNSIQRARNPEDEGYLVLGMIGARNNVNVCNARNFVQEALPQFRKFFAPIKIRFAGSMCSDLGDLDNIPNVELMGRVDTVEEFYQAIDVIIIPLTFSTGLKIKAVEGLSTGLPIIAHNHALEGIPTFHPSHQCDSLKEIIDYCIDLSFEQSKLPQLAEATRTTHLNIAKQASTAMQVTAKSIKQHRKFIVIVLNKEFFGSNSPQWEQAIQLIYYLKNLGSLIFYIDMPIDRKNLSNLEYQEAFGKVIFSANAIQQSDAVQKRKDKSKELYLDRYTISSLEDVFAKNKIFSLWLLDIPSDFRTTESLDWCNTHVYARTDVMRLNCTSEKNFSKDFLAPLSKCRTLTLVSCSLNTLNRELAILKQASSTVVPYWKELPWQIKEEEISESIYIIAGRKSTLEVHKILQICRELLSEDKRIVIVTNDSHIDKYSKLINDQTLSKSGICSINSLLNSFTCLRKTPKLVIDIGSYYSDDIGFSVYVETLERLGVPIVRTIPSPYSAPRSDAYRENKLDREHGILSDLFRALDKVINNDLDIWSSFRQEVTQKANLKYGNEAGWAKIWKEVNEAKSKIS